MPYPFDQIFAADPERPEMVATNAPVVVFAPGDETKTPLKLTTLNGLPLENPIIVNDRGFGPAFNADLDQVAWEGGGLTGLMASYRGLKDDAAAAVAGAVAAQFEAEGAKLAAEEAVRRAVLPTDDAIDEGIARANIPDLVARQVPVIVAGEPSETGDDAEQLDVLTSRVGVSVSLLPGRTYRLRSGITLGSNTTFDLNGATLDFTQMPVATGLGQRKAITAEGSIGPAIDVSAVVPQWSRIVAGISSTTSLSAGDLILLSNNERPIAGMTRTALKKAQLAVIRSVDSPTQITLTAGAIFQYGATGLRVQKITPVENITVHGGHIKLGGVGSGHNGINIRFGRNITVRDMTIEGAEDQSVAFSTVYNGKALHNTISDATSSTALGNTGYGVSASEASRYILIQGNQFRNCRHFVAGGGGWPTIQVDVLDNQGEHSKDAAYDCHEPCLYWTFRGNTTSGSDGVGFIIRGQHITVDNNTVIDAGSTGIRCYTFDGVSEQVGLRVTNNRVVRSAAGIEVDGLNRGGDTVDSIKRGTVITGNTIQTVIYAGLLVRNFVGAIVSDNIVYDVGAEDGILCTGLSAAKPSSDLTMTGNEVRGVLGAARIGIKLVDVARATVSATSAEDVSGEGITLLRCLDATVNASRVCRAGFAGLRIDGGGRVTVSGGNYSDATAATGDGIRVTASSDVTIAGTVTKNPRSGIYVTGTNYVSVTGNNARANGSGSRINIDATATSKVEANNIVA